MFERMLLLAILSDPNFGKRPGVVLFVTTLLGYNELNLEDLLLIILAGGAIFFVYGYMPLRALSGATYPPSSIDLLSLSEPLSLAM